MTVVRRMPQGLSALASSSSGFDWMTPGLWELDARCQASDETSLRDLGVCEACLSDVFDPGNRRHLYPFTSCPDCGPRYSILRKAPFLRANTTMSEFAMCEACEREVSDPNDRRHRHEANCCALCGPALRAVSSAGDALGSTAPLVLAARALRAQLTVALKGDGDYHLVCDATSGTAVSRMRDRAGMRNVPLTVMVRDLDEAARVARLTDHERSLLTSVERPVVLVSIRTDSPLAGEVAAGNQLAGLLLPYTPLHHLLLSESGRPLVFAPAGVRDSALLARNAAAVTALKSAADIFLVHDRQIAARDDDSIARVVDDHVTIEHRARGIAPVPVRLRDALAGPIVALGAGLERSAWFGSGSVVSEEPLAPGEALESAVVDRALARARDTMGEEPLVVAMDDSEQEPVTPQSVTVVPVQHHHAHYVSCMAENGLTGRVLAVVYDGGAPGVSDIQWGGEILLGGRESFERIATFRPLALPGAKAVRRQAWTASLSLLDDAFGDGPPLHALAMFRNLPRRSMDVVRRLRRRSACLTSGAQVFLDAIAAFLLNRAESPLDGMLARELDAIADPAVRGRYPVVIRDGASPWEIDLRSLVRQATVDTIDGISLATVAARVRNTIVEVTSEVLLAHGGGREIPVVLSGDLFERTALAAPIRARLGSGALVFTHSSVPAGDEGIGLGQVVIADSAVRRRAIPSEAAVPAETAG